MNLSSFDYSELVDTYFPGAFFSQLSEHPEENNDLPDIEIFAEQKGTNWVLNIQNMSKKEPFCCFFPSDAVRLKESDWESINQRLIEKRPKGGLVRPFVEMEDDRFIPLLNNISNRIFERKQDGFSVPEYFFIVLEFLNITAVYDYKKKTFNWDFSVLIRDYNPDSIYEAYKRYAHAEYTRLSFGLKELPLETDFKKLIKIGNEKIMNKVFTKFKISGKDWELVESALQAFPRKDPYTLNAIEEIKKDVLGQKKRRKKMGLEDPIFDHNDEVNISNAWRNISPFILDNAATEKEKTEINQAGLVMKVLLLYKTITNSSIKNNILNIKRINTIKSLYKKYLIYKSIDFSTYQNKYESDNDKDSDYDNDKEET